MENIIIPTKTEGVAPKGKSRFVKVLKTAAGAVCRLARGIFQSVIAEGKGCLKKTRPYTINRFHADKEGCGWLKAVTKVGAVYAAAGVYAALIGVGSGICRGTEDAVDYILDAYALKRVADDFVIYAGPAAADPVISDIPVEEDSSSEDVIVA